METAKNQKAAHISIFLDIITALIIVWLAILLFTLLRKTNFVCAATALALYIIEACMLVVSKFFGYGLIVLSDMYSANTEPAYEIISNVLLDVYNFSYNMHIIPFGIGAVMFYYLLYKSKALPFGLSLWGLITVVPVFAGTLLELYGVPVPFFVMLPYVPFEFFVGIYILVKGLKTKNTENESVYG